jgi:hypothetical protein
MSKVSAVPALVGLRSLSRKLSPRRSSPVFELGSRSSPMFA